MPVSSALRALVPDLLLDRVARRGADAHAFSCERLRAAVLFADVSGFTRLADAFASRGADGVDAFSALANSWFGRMVDVIAAHGGDLIRFAGDAPIAVFVCGESLDEVRAAVLRAHACASDLQRVGDALNPAGRDVVMRIGIGSGSVIAVTAGGNDGCWELLVGGEALRQAMEAERSAQPGQIVLSPEALAVEHQPGGDVQPQAAADGRLACAEEDLLRPFVSRSVLRFLDADQAAWTPELRRVSVLFAGLDGVAVESADGAGRVNGAFRQLQSAIFDHGGSVVQFLVDDKGLTLVAAWGVPGCTHEDDAARAVRAATVARGALDAEGVSCRIGIASGRVYCGWRGNERRREYALIGATVNLAARMMTAARDIVCDSATRQAVGSDGDFDAIEPLILKGHDEPVAAFRPRRAAAASSAGAREKQSVPSQPRGIIGRRAERQLLTDAVDALAARQHGATIVIRGEPGIGKSTLVADFSATARASGIVLATGSGESLATFEPYFAFRRVLAAVLDVRGRAGVEEYEPLIAEVLGVPMADNETTSQMTDQARVEKVRDLIVQLFNEASASSPIAVVIDNAHWLDSLSIGLLSALHRRVDRVLVVATTRPLDADVSAELADLVRSPSTRVIELARLDRADVHELICRQLGVTHVPDELTDAIEARAGGYPLFVAELASALLEAGVIQTQGSLCVLPAGGADLRAHRFPDSVQGAIADRIDRLDAAEQLTMKVASVIGAQFEVARLADVHPMTRDGAALERMLQRLERRGLIRRRADSGAVYEFGHAVVQDVAYGMMVAEQRRALHRAAAEAYERAGAAPPALLAYHWTRAEDEARSLRYLERAGAEAARKGAMQETVRSFRQALEIAGRDGAARVDRLRRVRWLRYVGFGLCELGAVPEAQGALRTALDLIGRPLPQSRTGLGMTLAREAVTQTARLAGLIRPARALPPAASERLLEEAEIMRLVGKMAFFAQDPLTYVAASLRSINLAERTAARETASSAYAALGYMVSMFGLEALGRRWWRLADESGDFDARLNRLAGGMLFLNSHVRWEESARLAAAQAELIERVGNSTSLPTHFVIRFYLHLHCGEIALARQCAASLLGWALAQNNMHEALSGRVHLLMAALEQGRVAEADHHIAAAAEIAPRADVPIYSIMFAGLRLDRQRRYGSLDAAARDADTLQSLLRRTPPYFGGEMSGYVALAEYAIALWQRARDSRERRAARSRARYAYGVLSRHAMLNPYARPRKWLVAGKLEMCKGRPGRATRLWRRALALSERYRMPRESAYAHAELGMSGVAHGWREHLTLAREFFVKTGCADRVGEIDAELEGPTYRRRLRGRPDDR